MKKIMILFVVLLAITVIFAQMPEKDQEACEYARKHDNVNLWLEYLKKFPEGSCIAEAQFSLGLLYQEGDGVQQDPAEAFKWYKKSAELGNIHAQNNLGRMYFQGESVPQNSAEAFKWYKKAAENGNTQSQYNLGVMYRNGRGVEQSYEKAVEYYRLARGRGNRNG
mgnify:FL=1